MKNKTTRNKKKRKDLLTKKRRTSVVNRKRNPSPKIVVEKKVNTKRQRQEGPIKLIHTLI